MRRGWQPAPRCLLTVFAWIKYPGLCWRRQTGDETQCLNVKLGLSEGQRSQWRSRRSQWRQEDWGNDTAAIAEEWERAEDGGQEKERKKEEEAENEEVEEEGSGPWINSRALAAELDWRSDLDSELESETEWECRRRQMELVKSLSTPLYQLWPRGDTMAERSHVASINKTNWWDSPAH